MEINRLLQFKLLYETGNMRRAAELLRLSIGGLSKSMKVLETELALKLFIPDGRGIRFTDHGKTVYRESLAMLESFERFRRACDREEERPGEWLRIGTFEVFSSYFSGVLAKRYLPRTPLALLELTPGRMEEALAAGAVDIGITYVPVPRPEVEFTRMGSIEMGIFARRRSFDGISPDELPFVIPVTPIDGAPTGVKGLDGWPDHLFPRKVAFRVELMESALELVRQGLAVAFIPKFVAELHNASHKSEFHLVAHAHPRGLKPVRKELYLATQAGKAGESRSIRQVAKALRTLS